MRNLLLVLAVLLALLSVSCTTTTNTSNVVGPGPRSDAPNDPDPNDPDPNDPDPNDPAGNDIVVTASGGVNPVYTWEGGPVHSISVMRTDNPTVPVWVIAALATTDQIQSGVTHGGNPAGTVTGVATELTLTAGVEYRVSVARAADTTSGWIEFTP